MVKRLENKRKGIKMRMPFLEQNAKVVKKDIPIEVNIKTAIGFMV